MLYLKAQYAPHEFNIYSCERVVVRNGAVWIESNDPGGTITLHLSEDDRHVAFFVMNENGTTFERFTGADLFPGNAPRQTVW